MKVTKRTELEVSRVTGINYEKLAKMTKPQKYLTISMMVAEYANNMIEAGTILRILNNYRNELDRSDE